MVMRICLIKNNVQIYANHSFLYKCDQYMFIVKFTYIFICLIQIFADFDFGQQRFRCKETRNQAINRSSCSESLVSLMHNRSRWLASFHTVLLTQYLRLQCCDVCAALLTVLQGRVEFGLQHRGLLLLRAQLQLQLRHARRGRRQLLCQACLPEIQRDDIKPAHPQLMSQQHYSDEWWWDCNGKIKGNKTSDKMVCHIWW